MEAWCAAFVGGAKLGDVRRSYVIMVVRGIGLRSGIEVLATGLLDK